MAVDAIYNPLDKDHLAESITRAFFSQEIHALPPEASFQGAGIYAIYYSGDYPLYRQIAASFHRYLQAARHRLHHAELQPIPIYIGKSEPPGSRKGVRSNGEDASDLGEGTVSGTEDAAEAKEILVERPKHRKLFERLRKHSVSIKMASGNLRPEDFKCRYMLMDEIWVPLGEAKLVDKFSPIWNVYIEGFGSNPEGEGRIDSARSVWDILHPGRKEKLRIQVDPARESEILQQLRSAETIEELTIAVRQHHDAKRVFRKAQKQLKLGKTV